MAKNRKAKKDTQKQAERRKRQILINSESYETWWKARRTQRPVPSDSYRAFMIDLGLHARLQPRAIWRSHTNRSDMPQIDYPSQWGHVPTPRPRERPRKQGRKAPRWVREGYVPTVKRSPLEGELIGHMEKMAEHYHVPMPRLVLGGEGGGVLSSYYAPKMVTNQPMIYIGTPRGASKAQTIAILSHEFGHHVHAYGEFLGTGRISSGYIQSKTIPKEHKAWEIAQPFMTTQRPVQKWVQRYAIGTYIGK